MELKGNLAFACFWLMGMSAALSAEPIHWTGGDWDVSGAPKGALLTRRSYPRASIS